MRFFLICALVSGSIGAPLAQASGIAAAARAVKGNVVPTGIAPLGLRSTLPSNLSAPLTNVSLTGSLQSVSGPNTAAVAVQKSALVLPRPISHRLRLPTAFGSGTSSPYGSVGRLPTAFGSGTSSPYGSVAAPKEPLHKRIGKALKDKTPLGRIYDGGRSRKHPLGVYRLGDGARGERQARRADATSGFSPSAFQTNAPTARDRDIERRTKKLIKVLQGGWLDRKTKDALRAEIKNLLNTYFAGELPEPGYNRAAKLLRRASSDIRRRHIQKAIANLRLAQTDIRHKTSYRATVRIRKRKDSRSRAEISYRYFVGGTRLKTLLYRLRKAGKLSHVRIGRGAWIAYDRLPLDLRLREDFVLDLVLERRKT